MTQRWNDLLFAHWPVSSEMIAALLPEGLEPDIFQGSAWLGVVPFWLDRIKIRGVPTVPGMRGFPDLNVRTYVRDQNTNTPGMYFFSLPQPSPVAIAARSSRRGSFTVRARHFTKASSFAPVSVSLP